VLAQLANTPEEIKHSRNSRMNHFLRVIRGNILHFSLLMVNCARPEALDFLGKAV
jgi:hypothetical protein